MVALILCSTLMVCLFISTWYLQSYLKGMPYSHGYDKSPEVVLPSEMNSKVTVTER